MPNRRLLKAEAKDINSTAKVNAYRFSLLFFVAIFVLRVLQDYVNRETLLLNLQTAGDKLLQLFPLTDLTAPVAKLTQLLHSISAAMPAAVLPDAAVTFVVVMCGLLNCLFNAGYVIYIMGVRRGETMGYGTLLDSFAFAGKIILLELWRLLVVALWSILFIIPGIIIFYRYSFALYNLLDDPSMSVTQAMFLSGRQTRGHKWSLFMLDLSFIGWDLLTPLTAGLLSIYVKPFKTQTWIGYYRAVSGKKPETDENPPEEPENYHYHRTDDKS